MDFVVSDPPHPFPGDFLAVELFGASVAEASLAGSQAAERYDPAHWSITEAAAVPEPTTWVMMGLGFAGIGALAYRARRKAAVAA